jgi:hypothetical protein
MSTTRTQFTFRVDTWTPDGESIVEHVAVSRTLAGASHGGRNPPDRVSKVTYYRWRQEFGGRR